MGIMETLVAPFIKGIMGQYFSNFDSSKLDIGMGNVELTEMLVRPGLLEDMGVPLKLVFGKVGRVYLEFAVTTIATDFWSSRDVVVEVKDVYVLLAPPTSVKYQDDREGKKEAKRKALEKMIENDPALGGPAATANDASVVVGIINNIKITVENIHIRYEDELSNPGSPFAFGITLKKLAAISTDELWNPKPTDKYAETFYKLVSLEGLGVYWNSHTTLLRPRVFTPDSEAASIAKMQNLLGADEKELKFVIGPLKADVKAIVTMSPNKLKEKFSKPMADVTLSLEGFNVDVTDLQFHDAMLLMESLEDQSRRQPFLAFRPFGVPYNGYEKKWWTYAYNCIRVGVRRRNRLYDPEYLVKQQRLCKSYELAYADYMQKAGLKTATEEDKQKYVDLEDQISNQDVLIIRKKVAMKYPEIVKEQKEVKGWWSTSKVALDPVELKKTLESNLTAEEMKEIQEYISFEPQDAEARNFPPGYTQLHFKFALSKCTSTVKQVQPNGSLLEVLQFLTKDFSIAAKVYPAEKGLWAEVGVGSMAVTGFPSDGIVPSMARDLTELNEKFVVVSYAKNPRDKKPGQYIFIKSERIEIVYDSPTIQKLIDCFTWPSGVELAKTTAAVSNAMQDAKSMSVTGLKEMIQNTEEIFIDISSKAPYFMLPSGGCMATADTIVVLNAGKFEISTTPRARSVTNGSEIETLGGIEEGDVSLEVLKLTYNQYVAKYSNMECFVALKGEDITKAITHTFEPVPEGTYPVDRPVLIFSTDEMVFNVNQCIIKDDPRFPKIKVEISVPLLDFSITDYRTLKLVRLLATIPMPQMKPALPSAFIEGADDEDFYSDTQLDSVKEAIESFQKEETAEEKAYDPETAPQFTNLMIHFAVDCVKVLLLRLNLAESSTTPLLNITILRAELFMRFRTFGLSLDFSTGSVNAAYLDASVPGQAPGTPVYLLKTPDDMYKPLLKGHLFSISEACPKSRVGDVRQKASIETQCVDVTLHQECLEDLLALADRILKEFTTSRSKAKTSIVIDLEPVHEPTLHKALKTKDKEGRTTAVMKALGIKNLPNAGDILVSALAVFTDFNVSLTSEKSEIASFHIGKLIADYEDRPLKSRTFLQVEDVEVANLVQPTYYTRLVSSGTEHPFFIGTVTMYKEALLPTEPDIEAQIQLNCPPMILMGEYVGHIADFITHLIEAAKTVQEEDAKVKELAADPNTIVLPAVDVAPTIELHEPIKVVEKKVKDPYATDKKLSLDVKLSSPKLIIVRDTMSPDAVCLDLGNLVVTNKLQEVKTNVSHSAVLDNMNITLDGITITRVLMDTETQEIKAGVHILEPVLIKLNVQRSLSAWYKQLPSMEVKGELETTALRVSALDVEVVGSCIFNYIKKLQMSMKQLKSCVDTEEDDDEADQHIDHPDHPGHLIGGAEHDEAIEAHKLGAKFTIVQIGLFAYQLPTPLDGASTLVTRDPAGALAEFYIQTMDAAFKQWSNEDMEANLILQEILLRDARPTTAEIKDFLLKKEDTTHPDAPVLQVSLATAKASDDTPIYTVHLTNQGLTVILYLEFMKAILDFSLSVASVVPKDITANLKLEDKSAVKLDAKKEKKPSMKLMGIRPEDRHLFEEEEEPMVLPMVKGSVTLSQTEFLLLESTKSAETNALIAYGGSSFTMDADEQRGSWGGGTWDFGIITAQYSPDKPKENVCDVLEPVTMTAKASLSQHDGINLEVSFSDMYLHVNAGILLLINKFVNTLKDVVEASKHSKAEFDMGRKDYSDVWDARDNFEQEYWFLDYKALVRTINRHKETKEQALMGAGDAVITASNHPPETFKFNLGRAVVLVEAGVSTKPTAMIMLDSHVLVTVQNWSTDLTVDATVGGSICYNNIRKGTWEYLQEPNAGEDNTFKPWDINVKVKKLPEVGGKSAIVINASTDEILEITVSKSSVQLLKAIGDNFSNSLKFGATEEELNTPPYVFQNDAYTDIYLSLDEDKTGLTYTAGTTEKDGYVLVSQGQTLELGLKLQDIRIQAGEQKDRLLSIYIPEFKDFRATISARYNQTAYYQMMDSQGKPFGMLVEISGKANFSTLIVVRSVVQLKSELSTPVQVKATSRKTAVEVGTLEPYQSINLPLSFLHSGVANVALSFTTQGYQTSTASNVLGILATTSSKARDFVTVKSATPGAPDGKIRLIGNCEPMFVDGAIKSRYDIVLKPPLVINNFVPLPVEVSTDGTHFNTVEPGTPIDLLTANTESTSSQVFFKIKDYEDTTWTAHMRLKLKSGSDNLMFLGGDFITVGQINSILFTSESNRRLYMRFRPTVSEDKLEEVSLFCPYWMVNRTGLTLYYQVTRVARCGHRPCALMSKVIKWLHPTGASSWSTNSRIVHGPNEEPKMLAYDVDGKEKAKFMIEDSEWSEAVSLDAPMTAELVCKGKDKDYEIIVSVVLSASNLTKTVSFTPKHSITNACAFDILLSHVGKANSEFEIPAHTTIPFWPIAKIDKPTDLMLKVKGTDDYTSPFHYDGVHISLLKLPNKFGGVCSNVSVVGTKGTLAISEFDMTEVPVLIVNDTRHLDLEFNQAGIDNIISVPARKSVVYALDNILKARTIQWAIPQLKGTSGFPKSFQMNTASQGEFEGPSYDVDEDATKTYKFGAFVSGIRTIFVITESANLIASINDYLSIGQATEPGTSNPLTLEANINLEGIGLSIVDDHSCNDVLYLRVESTPPMWEGIQRGGTYSTLAPQEMVALEKGYLNFISGKNTKRPAVLDGGIKIDYTNFQMSYPRNQKLRRHAYKAGISAMVKVYEFSKEVNLCVAKVQVDNQLEGAAYPQLFVAAPLHQSVTLESEIPPPLFILDMKDRTIGTGPETINGALVLQEFCLAVDTTIIVHIIAVFSSDQTVNMAPRTKSLYAYDRKRATLSDKEYYEGVGEVVSSESKIAFYEQVSVYKMKMQVTASISEDPDGGIFYNMLMCIGASTVSVSEVPIWIGGLEITKKRWTRDQLKDAIISHYVSAIMANMLQVVLGLDLLGNPTKLLSGITGGLTSLLTEPLQGAMSGNLIGGITSGAEAATTGLVFGLTDSLGSVSKQLGKLTKGLGLFGVHQLLTGLGGLLGGVSSIAGDKKTVEHVRPRRIMFPNRPLRPYSLFGLTGDTVLMKALYDFQDCGQYITHYQTTQNDGTEEVLLVTQGRVYCAGTTTKLDAVFRKWSNAWSEIIKIEKTPANGVVFKQQPAKSSGLFSWCSTSRDNTALLGTPAAAAAALQDCKKACFAATGH